jgi:hypothetical protein
MNSMAHLCIARSRYICWVVLGPFVGTGSLLKAATEFGGDIDFLTLHAS